MGRYSFFCAPHAGHGGTLRNLTIQMNDLISNLYANAADLGQSLDIQFQLSGGTATPLPPASSLLPINVTMQWITIT